MVVYTAGDLKDLLIEAGFSTIQVVHNKEEMYIIDVNERNKVNECDQKHYKLVITKTSL